MAAASEKTGESAKNKAMDKTATEKEGDALLKKDESAAGNAKKRGRGAKKVPAAKAVEEKQLDEKPDVEKLPRKKARMGCAALAITAKEDAELLADEKLGEARSASKQKPKKTSASTKRVTSVDKVVEEAKAAFGSLDTSEGRRLRKRPPAAAYPAKPSMKKAGTMQKTAKEGKAFLKRGRAKKAT